MQHMPSLFNSTWSFQNQHAQDRYSPPTEELDNLSLSGIHLARSARSTHAHESLNALDIAQNKGLLDVAPTPGSYPSTPFVLSRSTLATPALENNSMPSPALTFHHMHPPTPHIHPSATPLEPSADEYSMPLSPSSQDTGNSLGLHHMHAAALLPTPVSKSPSTPEPEPEIDNAPDLVTKPKIPRPPNAFILYRSHILKKIREKQPKPKNKNQQFFSRVAGEAWNRTTLEERQPFIAEAKKALEAHHKKYPNYKFSPQRKGSRMKGRLGSDQETGADDTESITNFVENVLGIQDKVVQEKPRRCRRKGRTQHSEASTSRVHTASSQSATVPASPATAYHAFELEPMQPTPFVFVPHYEHWMGLVGAPPQHIPPFDTGINTVPSLPSIPQVFPTYHNTSGQGLTPATFPHFLTMTQMSPVPFGSACHHSAELGPAPAPFIPSSTMPHTSLDSFGYPVDHPMLIAPRRPSSSQGFFRQLERGDVISRPASTVPAVSYPSDVVHDHVMHSYMWNRTFNLAGDGFTLPSADDPWDKLVDLSDDAQV
ncbi:uncharacterized protein EV420DRAFT_1473981 [Desarmillaria tabescens]|uniref:HMG box domain-containing protein n=1 Tax=Armillaria tabescens TaxID=1929756 RepID=A0AA39NMA8_ARMTA|nr:uncharacterized protein EV420DRAFT_1473981 [Desarmillaria tabescens]KAK0468277.1 hypothetical protein EV420DRAFT_1473981 [Desarmillaria tabescens]